MATFKISVAGDKFADWLLRNDDFNPDPDMSPLDNALLHYERRHSNEYWTIQLESDVYIIPSDLMQLVFEELPQFIKDAQDESLTEYTLGIIEQGSTLIKVKNLLDNNVEVAIIEESENDLFWDYFTGKIPLDALHFHTYVVDKTPWIAEWKRFIKTVLDSLVLEKLIDADDESLHLFLSLTN